MSFNRPNKSSSTPSERISPNLRTPVRKENFDDNPVRSSPPPPLYNERASYLRKKDDGDEFDRSFDKSHSESDTRFRQLVFERFADPPSRALIANREKFLQALSCVGYDLPKSIVEQVWSRNEQEITFKTFQRILNEEKPIDDQILNDAFETLYNKDRPRDSSILIDYDRFRTDLIEKGDRLTNDEFDKIRYLLGTEHGKVDARKLVKSIVKSKITCRTKILTTKIDYQEEKRPLSRGNSPGSQTNNVHIVIPPSNHKLSIPPKGNSLSMKGAFFCEYAESTADTLLYSIGYAFEIKQTTPVWFTVESNTSRYHKDMAFKQIDIRLLLFEKIPHKRERRLIEVSSNRSGTKSFLHLDELRRGTYEIVPITFGGVLRSRSRDMNNRNPIKNLREPVKTAKKGGDQHYVMTRDYREALEFIFDLFDFDGNKQLDRQEYNLWTVRTTGEEILDEDWFSIRDTVHLDPDENISKEKFLKLNNIEVDHPDTTDDTLWIGLNSVGFNYALELDMMCPFNLTIHTHDNPDLRLKPTAFIELTEIKPTLIKFFRTKSDPIKLNNPSVTCYDYSDDYGSMLFVENKGVTKAQVAITITNTKNAALTLPIDARKPTRIDVKGESSQFVWFAHKLDSQRAMELDATVRVQ